MEPERQAGRAPERGIGGDGLLSFLAPGLLHGLGNALFAVQGHGQMLGAPDADLAVERAAIVEASRRAQDLLHLFRRLLGESAGPPHDQAGLVLNRIAELLRVPLREHRLRLVVRHQSVETPVTVDAAALGRAVAQSVRRLVREAPAGFEGAMEVDLRRQEPERATGAVALTPDPSILPFPVDRSGVVADLSRTLTRSGVLVRIDPARPAGVILQAPAVHSVE